MWVLSLLEVRTVKTFLEKPLFIHFVKVCHSVSMATAHEIEGGKPLTKTMWIREICIQGGEWADFV